LKDLPIDTKNSIITGIEQTLVQIPSGQLRMRDDRIDTHWIAEIPTFLIGKFPVTQQQYHAVTAERPSTFFGDQKPVETISWIEAVLFCNAISALADLQLCYQIDIEKEQYSFDMAANGYRLPTEAEWEFACRAGTTGIRYGNLAAIGWYKGNSGNGTQEVGQKQPNDWGLYDMLGNVWEWCADIYDETVYGSYRIMRGGGWYDEPRGCLVTNRRRSHPVAYRIDDLGFRLARNR